MFGDLRLHSSESAGCWYQHCHPAEEGLFDTMLDDLTQVVTNFFVSLFLPLPVTTEEHLFTQAVNGQRVSKRVVLYPPAKHQLCVGSMGANAGGDLGKPSGCGTSMCNVQVKSGLWFRILRLILGRAAQPQRWSFSVSQGHQVPLPCIG